MIMTTGNKRKGDLGKQLLSNKQLRLEKLNDFFTNFAQFVSPIYDTAICENTDNDGLSVVFDREEMSRFITAIPESKISTLRFSTLYKSSSSSNHKWSMNFAWGAPKKNPCFNVQLVLNGTKFFREFTVQQDTTYNETVGLAIHWDESFQTPTNFIEYDRLIWAGQLSLTCLQDFFTTKLTRKEENSLIDKGFKSLPIKTIVKSVSLFDTEFINPIISGTHITKNARIMKHFFVTIGFEHRRGHFEDWALILNHHINDKDGGEEHA